MSEEPDRRTNKPRNEHGLTEGQMKYNRIHMIVVNLVFLVLAVLSESGILMILAVAASGVSILKLLLDKNETGW